MSHKIIKLKTGRFRVLELIVSTGEWLSPAGSMDDFDTKEEAMEWMLDYASRER